jgi:hypothetical protein
MDKLKAFKINMFSDIKINKTKSLYIISNIKTIIIVH